MNNNRTVNNNQLNTSNKINALIKGKEEIIIESKTEFNKKGKYLIGNKLTKLNHLAKFTLKENTLSLNPKNIKMADYDVDLNGGTGAGIFFVLPQDEQFLEAKNGRTLEFNIQDLSDFVQHQLPNASEFTSKDHNDPQGSTYFDFDTYWGGLDELQRLDDLKQFITQTINKSGVLPELN